jgi:hypothetical protein
MVSRSARKRRRKSLGDEFTEAYPESSSDSDDADASSHDRSAADGEMNDASENDGTFELPPRPSREIWAESVLFTVFDFVSTFKSLLNFKTSASFGNFRAGLATSPISDDCVETLMCLVELAAFETSFRVDTLTWAEVLRIVLTERQNGFLLSQEEQDLVVRLTSCPIHDLTYVERVIAISLLLDVALENTRVREAIETSLEQKDGALARRGCDGAVGDGVDWRLFDWPSPVLLFDSLTAPPQVFQGDDIRKFASGLLPGSEMATALARAIKPPPPPPPPVPISPHPQLAAAMHALLSSPLNPQQLAARVQLPSARPPPFSRRHDATQAEKLRALLSETEQRLILFFRKHFHIGLPNPSMAWRERLVAAASPQEFAALLVELEEMIVASAFPRPFRDGRRIWAEAVTAMASLERVGLAAHALIDALFTSLREAEPRVMPHRQDWLRLLGRPVFGVYIPQVGDAVVYMKRGHKLHLDKYPSRVWDKGAGTGLDLNSDLLPFENCVVEAIEYFRGFSGAPLCAVKLRTIPRNLAEELAEERRKGSEGGIDVASTSDHAADASVDAVGGGDLLTMRTRSLAAAAAVGDDTGMPPPPPPIRYPLGFCVTLHLENEYADFIVSAERFQKSMAQPFRAGCEVRMFFFTDRASASGRVYKGRVLSYNYAETKDPWEAMEIKWSDGQDVTRVSPWEVELVSMPAPQVAVARPKPTISARSAQNANEKRIVGGVEVDPAAVMAIVEREGGWDRVTDGKKWSSVARELGIDTNKCTNAANAVKRIYQVQVFVSGGGAPRDGEDAKEGDDGGGASVSPLEDGRAVG